MNKLEISMGHLIARFSLTLFVIVFSSFANANVKNHIPDCSYQHPEQDFFSSGMVPYRKYFDVIGIKGDVKRAVIKWSEEGVKNNGQDESELIFDREGNLLRMRMKENMSEQKYEYHTDGRLARIILSFKKTEKTQYVPEFLYVFSYFQEKNMVFVKEYALPSNKWLKSQAIIREANPDGSQACYDLVASERYGTEGHKYLLSVDGNKYTHFSRAELNAYSSANTENDAEATMLRALNDLKSVTDSVCSRSNLWECKYYIKNKDADLDTFSEYSSGSDKKDVWERKEWRNKGFLVEFVNKYSQTLPDGSAQHTSFVYSLDDHNNWVKIDEYLSQPATLLNHKTTWRKRGATTRKIEYFN